MILRTCGFLLCVVSMFILLTDRSWAAGDNKAKALAHYTMGVIYDNKGEVKSAVSEYKKTLKYNPDSALARLRLGVGYLVLGEEANGVKELELVEKNNPEYLQVTFMLALIYTSLGNFTDAGTKYEKLVETNPGDINFRLALAYIYIKEKKYENALEILDDTLLNDPLNAKVFFYKGVAYEEIYREKKDTSSYKDAVQNFRKAIALDPEMAEAYNYLGYMFAEQGANLDEAIALAQKAVKLYPDNGAYLDSLGWAYYKKDMIDEAMVNLKKAASIEMEDPTVREHLGDVCFEKGLYSEARIQWEKALELDPGKTELKEKIEKLTIGVSRE